MFRFRFNTESDWTWTWPKFSSVQVHRNTTWTEGGKAFANALCKNAILLLNILSMNKGVITSVPMNLNWTELRSSSGSGSGSVLNF